MTYLAVVGKQMVLAEDFKNGHKDIPATHSSVHQATRGTLKQLRKSYCTETSPVFL